MKVLKKLANPILLTLQGFVAGAILFFATHPDSVDLKPGAPVQRSQPR